MCTYETETLSVRASGKTAQGWTSMSDAAVYFDHPVHFSADHALMIDVRNVARGPSARVALEMSPASARALANSILRVLEAVPAGLLTTNENENGNATTRR
jgi:Family of unknown function (DUF6295)